MSNRDDAARALADMVTGATQERPKRKPPKAMHRTADEIDTYLRRYCVLGSDHHYAAAVLWALHTHVVECFDTTPRLFLDSAVPGSGKSRVLELLEHLVRDPLNSFSASPAALIRSIDAGARTILMDEIDTLYVKSAGTEDITAVVNAGYKRGAMVPRCVGQGMDIEVVELSAFAPMALAGLHANVPDAVRSRSIHFRMRKRIPATEPLDRYRRKDAEAEAAPMRAKLTQWSESTVTDALADARPDLPDGVEDRPAEVWEPLIAVADTIGGQWPTRAREACCAFVFARSADGPSLGVEILTAIHEIMAARKVDDITTTALITEIRNMRDQSPWPPSRGDLEPAVLARLLRPFDVAPQQFKHDGRKVRGYRRYGDGGLFDAFERYVESASADVVPITRNRRFPALDGAAEVRAVGGYFDRNGRYVAPYAEID
ncbi:MULTISPECIES: DUF3631 domain-containing protein [unclassified Gordonia (in: high G+C Gram-positive bacteria)]|uniref:DUF3631 domain-containing protein n=1 Tax=unclassified Gordonia (in: high G+C Gram-positive bacteria) TaxID=2657482 RepID=UPI0019659E7C|nr:MULTISPECIES: DUF3631 domain-containing protein [unclassified Gordonia (in: high G+C Gram-positive bacteria)]MBN0974258.1 DUF3631 domain-containing protein [Gordonia sp. BP-119]MBN0981908.1 DUF3631 domain-containing protein [Gordonia sp. BP-94]